GGGEVLEEGLALWAVDVALEDDRPPCDSPEGTLRDRHVVPGQVVLRVAGPRKEDLVRIGDRDLAARDLQDDLPRPAHRNSVPESPAGTSLLREEVGPAAERRPRSLRARGRGRQATGRARGAG